MNVNTYYKKMRIMYPFLVLPDPTVDTTLIGHFDLCDQTLKILIKNHSKYLLMCQPEIEREPV